MYMVKTELDVGIDIEGFLNVFIPRQTEAPFETVNHIRLSNLQEDSIVLSIYEGICIQSKFNHCLKQIRLENVREGMFLIQMKLMEKDGVPVVRVMSDDIILDDIVCNNDVDKWKNNDCEEDRTKREWYKSRESFVEFVDNAREFLNDADVKPHIRSILQTNEDHMYFQEMMKRLNEAGKVIDLCDDVTKDEYDMMLEEIAEIVNPFIAGIQKIVRRDKL